MAATTPYCTFKNLETGQTVTLGLYYAGADTVGYIVPCSMSGVASANSPKDFKLPSGVWTIQYISGPASGKIRLWCNGAPGPIALDMASVIGYGCFWRYLWQVQGWIAVCIHVRRRKCDGGLDGGDVNPFPVSGG